MKLVSAITPIEFFDEWHKRPRLIAAIVVYAIGTSVLGAIAAHTADHT
jgi:hypothetical protein